MLAQKRIQNAIFVVLALLFGGNFSAPAFAVETSATVIDFYNLSQDKEWVWLSQGLADMLITDLSSVDHFQIVDREGLQKYLDELELQGSGLIDHQSLISVGLLAGVEKVIFGTYQVDGNAKINVQATIVDIVSQRAEKAVRVSGEISEVLDLEKERVVEVLSLEQDDEAAGAHAAHPDDLERQVDESESAQQRLEVIGHRLEVCHPGGGYVLANPLRVFLDCHVPQRNDQR